MHQRLGAKALPLLLSSTAAGGLLLAIVMPLHPREAAGMRSRALKLDVSQDGSTFVFQGPTTAAGFPAAGATFIVQGVVYPGGTLQGGAVSGANPDGTPSFPDLVVGTWSCRGWFTHDCDPEVTGPVLVGQQVWNLDLEEPGAQTILTDGGEPSINEVDLNVPFRRGITGGTGRFRQAGGEQTSTNFGFNPSFGIDSTHELVLVGRGDD